MCSAELSMKKFYNLGTWGLGLQKFGPDMDPKCHFDDVQNRNF